MENLNGKSWGDKENRVSFSNGFALLEGSIWGVDCSEKYKYEITQSGIRIIIDSSSTKGFDLIKTGVDTLIFKQNSPPYFLDRIK